MPPPKTTGVSLNSQVPEINAKDIKGNKQTLKQLSGEKGLVLVFFRSADWCPFCKKHLVEINDWTQKLDDEGYKVAAISYDSIETLKMFSDERKLNYPLLADQDNKTMENYKVLNQEQKPGTMHYGIPYPGVMVIDKEGKLLYKYFYQGYRMRVNFEMIFNALNKKPSI